MCRPYKVEYDPTDKIFGGTREFLTVDAAVNDTVCRLRFVGFEKADAERVAMAFLSKNLIQVSIPETVGEDISSPDNPIEG